MDKVTKKVRSKIMASIKGKNSRAEVLLKKSLSKAGYKYKSGYRIAGYRPDIVMPSKKLAIFVDGCFWHKCPIDYKEPKSNRSYWIPKIAANVKRDKRIDTYLRSKGWVIMHFWEHELKKGSLEAVILKVSYALA